MLTTQCAICAKRQKFVLQYKSTLKKNKINSSTFSARRTPDRVHYRFVKCMNCGLIFSNPILPSDEIIKYYEHSDFDYAIESGYLKKTYGSYLTKAIGSRQREKINLLDIGCGNGFFLEEAKKQGISKVVGVEPGRQTVDKAPKWLKKFIIQDIFKTGQFRKNTFDIICCFHTLDHIIDPNKFLKGVYSVLKEGGRAYFIVHDTDGLSVKIFGEKSPIFDIEHIYLFNDDSLKAIFKKNKFKIIETFQVKNYYPISYWIRMSPLPRVVKLAILKLIDRLPILNFNLALKAGNIGIIAEK